MDAWIVGGHFRQEDLGRAPIDVLFHVPPYPPLCTLHFFHVSLHPQRTAAEATSGC